MSAEAGTTPSGTACDGAVPNPPGLPPLLQARSPAAAQSPTATTIPSLEGCITDLLPSLHRKARADADPGVRSSPVSRDACDFRCMQAGFTP
jgi:hypothetical protein